MASRPTSPRALDHPEPAVREWTVRIIGNDGATNDLIARKLVALGLVRRIPRCVTSS